MSDNSNAKEPEFDLDKYIQGLSADDTDFDNYMNQMDILSFEEFLRIRREAAAQLKTLTVDKEGKSEEKSGKLGHK